MVDSKKYRVIRPFRRVDPRTGESTSYEPGDDYSGPVEGYFGDGPDGAGALLADKPAPSSSPDAVSRAGDSKDK